MNKLTFAVFLVFLIMAGAVFAQPPLSNALKDITYTFQRDNGTNASAVAYNSDRKIYYTVIAGNIAHPIEVFDIRGNTLSTSMAGYDFRSLWWNPRAGQLEGAAEGSWIIVSLQNDGYPYGTIDSIVGDTLQPTFDAVGDLNTKKSLAVFYARKQLHIYSRKKMELKDSLVITGLPPDIGEMNSTTVCYTGHKGYEYALLDIDNKRVCYVDQKGRYKTFSSLPYKSVTSNRFRFSYANDRVWLYDISNRTWTSYIVFEH